MAKNPDGTYSQVGFIKDADGNDVEFVKDKNGTVIFEKGFTREKSGTLPLQLDGIGKPLKNYTIYGNTIQNGTPTPDIPVEVQAVGDRTENLFDITKNVIGNIREDGSVQETSSELYNSSDFIAIKANTDYTVSFLATYNLGGRVSNITYYDSEKKFLTYMTNVFNGVSEKSHTTTSPNNAKYLRFSYIGRGSAIDKNIMLNEGETALPYEPYGYKIPVETRGKNLFDKNDCTVVGYINSEGKLMSDGSEWFTNKNYIKCSGVITITALNGLGSAAHVACYDEQKNLLGACPISDNNSKQSTISLVDGTIYIKVCSRSNNLDSFLLELGTEATEYEPYHEPITTPIYLDSPLYKNGNYADAYGMTEEVRAIKEFVVTGAETITEDIGYNRFYFTIQDMRSEGVRLTKLFCTHYQNISDGRPIANVPNNSIYTGGGTDSQKVFIKTTDHTTVADFKSYLAAQYAAGTPVKVYYILAEPKTESVTLPKISTLDGTTVIDVETTVKPSKMDIKYKSKI